MLIKTQNGKSSELAKNNQFNITIPRNISLQSSDLNLLTKNFS